MALRSVLLRREKRLKTAMAWPEVRFHPGESQPIPGLTFTWGKERFRAGLPKRVIQIQRHHQRTDARIDCVLTERSPTCRICSVDRLIFCVQHRFFDLQMV